MWAKDYSGLGGWLLVLHLLAAYGGERISFLYVRFLMGFLAIKIYRYVHSNLLCMKTIRN